MSHDFSNKALIAENNLYNVQSINSPTFVNDNSFSLINKNGVEKYLLHNISNISNNDYIFELQKAYNERISSLYHSIGETIENLITDELLITMKNDNMEENKEEFMKSRITEILDMNFYNEKEKYIEALCQENAKLKSKYNNNNYSAMVTSSNTPLTTVDNSSDYMSKVKTMNIEQEIFIKELQKQISSQTTHINDLLKEIQISKKKYDNLNSEFSNLNLIYSKQTEELNKYKQEDKNYQKNLEHAKGEIQRLNKVISVIEIELSTLEKEHQSKIQIIDKTNSDNYKLNMQIKKSENEVLNQKRVIDSYKNEREELINSNNKSKLEINKLEREKNELIEKLNNLNNEILKNEKVKEESEKEKENLKKSNSSLCVEMKNKMQGLCLQWEQKFNSIENDYGKKLKELESKNRDYEMNYISIEEHNNIVNQKIKETAQICEKKLKCKKDKIYSEFNSNIGEITRIKELSMEEAKKLKNQNENLNNQIQGLFEENANLKSLQNNTFILQEENINLKENIEREEKVKNNLYAENSNLMQKILQLQKDCEAISNENKTININLALIKEDCKNKIKCYHDTLNDTIIFLKSQLLIIKEYAIKEIQKEKNLIENDKELINTKIIQFLGLVNQKNNVELNREKEIILCDLKRITEEKDNANTKIQEIANREEANLNNKENKIKDLINNLLAVSSSIENFKQNYLKEIFEIKKKSKNLLDINQNRAKIMEEKDNQLKIKEKEISEFQENFLKLKNVYENKINLMNLKLSKKEDKYKEASNKNINKDEEILRLNNLLKEERIKSNNYQKEIDINKEEFYQFKKDCQKLISDKDKKINKLQEAVNQTMNELNQGVNNIQIANKLDSEVKNLVRTAKGTENFVDDK